MPLYIVSEGQNIYDVAIQEYGDTEGVYLLLEDNPTLSLDSVLNAGQLLTIKSAPLNMSIVAYFKRQKYRINTGTVPATPTPSTCGLMLALPAVLCAPMPPNNVFPAPLPMILNSPS